MRCDNEFGAIKYRTLQRFSVFMIYGFLPSIVFIDQLMPQIENLSVDGEPMVIGTACMVSWGNRCVHALLMNGGFWVSELCPAIHPGEIPTPLSIRDICGTMKPTFSSMLDMEDFLKKVPATIRRLIGHITKRTPKRATASDSPIVVDVHKAKRHKKTAACLCPKCTSSGPTSDVPKQQTSKPEESHQQTSEEPLLQTKTPQLPLNSEKTDMGECIRCGSKVENKNLSVCGNPGCDLRDLPMCLLCLDQPCTFGHVPAPVDVPPVEKSISWLPDPGTATKMTPPQLRDAQAAPRSLLCVMCGKSDAPIKLRCCMNTNCELYPHGGMCRVCYAAGCASFHIPSTASQPCPNIRTASQPVPTVSASPSRFVPLTCAPFNAKPNGSCFPSPLRSPNLLPHPAKLSPSPAAPAPPTADDIFADAAPDLANDPIPSAVRRVYSDVPLAPPRPQQPPKAVAEQEEAPMTSMVRVLETLVRSVDALHELLQAPHGSQAPKARSQTAKSEERYLQRQVDNRCFVCGSLEHWVKDCPKSTKPGPS